jgi:hypothetical protein
MVKYSFARIFLSTLVFSITVITAGCGGGGGSSSNPAPSEQTYNVELRVSSTTDDININAITIDYNVNGNEQKDINITHADMPWTIKSSNVSSGVNVSLDIHYDNYNGSLYTDDHGTILAEILVDGVVKEQETLVVKPSSSYVSQEITVALQESDWSN